MWEFSKKDHHWLRNLYVAGAASPLQDAELLDRFRSGTNGVSHEAFESLVLRHGPMVLSVCRKVVGDPNDVEDAFQATFFILATRARSIRTQRSVASWLHGVALRVASRLRATSERRMAGQRKLDEARVQDVERDMIWLDDDDLDHEILHQEVQRLPRKYREVIVLCYFQGLTQEAAASQLRCPSSTVGVRLMRARAQLKARLSRRGISRPGGAVLATLLLWYSLRDVPESLAASTARLMNGTGGKLSARASRIAAEVVKKTFTVRCTRIGTVALVLMLATASFGGVVTHYARLMQGSGWNPLSGSASVMTNHYAPLGVANQTDRTPIQDTPTMTPVPEPSTFVIAGTMTAILGGYAWVRRNKVKV
jgi:RNA polymerase sigma-70 factor (ECF subfamily)